MALLKRSTAAGRPGDPGADHTDLARLRVLLNRGSLEHDDRWTKDNNNSARSEQLISTPYPL